MAPAGELPEDLIACVGRSKVDRMPPFRGWFRMRGQMSDLLGMHIYPPETNDWTLPGRLKGEAVKGADKRPTVRMMSILKFRLVTLNETANAMVDFALDGFMAKLPNIAGFIRMTLACDRSEKTACTAELTINTAVSI